MADEPIRPSATTLRAAIGAGVLSLVDLVEACLARIDACEPEVHAFVQVDHAGARRWGRCTAFRPR